ncbi:MAG: T9SS type A sorting domain-containing protein [Bacteroidota bacterium]
MKRLLTIITFSLLTFSLIQAQSVTFTEDIASIIYENCTPCHRAGEIGPMPFTTYQEIRDWGPMIEYVTSINYMPPWPPDPNFQEFQGERFLSDGEKQKIADWVSAGMPEGPANAAPPLPQFPTGSQVGTPDLVLSFSQAYLHQGNNVDQYQNFVLPTGLTEDKILKAIELRPGNNKIVHHALFALDTTGQAQLKDAQDPSYGYSGFGGFGVDKVEDYPGYVPGALVITYPEGLGQPIYANSDLLIQMHYAPVPVDETDSSTVNLFFADPDEIIGRTIQREVMLPFGSTLINGPFVIQPNTVKQFHGVWTVPFKVSLLGVAPHMHLLGKDWEVYAVSPAGDTTSIVSIPEWDFNWQGTYFFKQFQIIEAGSEIHALATYDNSTNNPFNPNNPPKRVRWGEGTADEMFYLPFMFVNYQQGDEFLVFSDTSTTTNIEELANLRLPEDKFYPPYPNPTREDLTIGFSLSQSDVIQIEILDVQGRLIKTVAESRIAVIGPNKADIKLDDLAPGLYLINLYSDRVHMTRKFMVSK